MPAKWPKHLAPHLTRLGALCVADTCRGSQTPTAGRWCGRRNFSFSKKDTAMANKYVKLQTNIPLIGVVKYVDFAPTTKEGYSDQIAVRGTWEGEDGEPRVYLPMALEGRFQELGIVGAKSTDGNYPVKIAGAKIKIVKTEAGKKHLTTVELLNGTAGTTGKPASSAPAGGLTPPPQAGGSNKAKWDSYVETMRACYVEAKTLLAGQGITEVATAEIQACAHSLFIQSARDGLWRTPPSKTPQEKFATEAQKLAACEMFAKLDFTEAEAKAEIQTRFAFDSIDKLTEGNVAALIKALEDKLAAQKDVHF